MREEEICSGCSRHVASCMCCTGLGPDGPIISRPNPTNLAGKLKIIAQNAKLEEIRDADKYNQVFSKVRRAAQQGQLSISIWFTDMALIKPEAEEIVVRLINLGFKASISREIVNWYSNTDWDEDYLLTISWE